MMMISPAATTDKILSRFGYRVRWFRHPEAALADFQAHPTEYDLVVSDLAMPGMAGNHFAAALRRLRPEFPVLIITGMMDPALVREARENGTGRLLFKPVNRPCWRGKSPAPCARARPNGP